MRLEHLAARGFRNLEPVDLAVDGRFVVVHGRNAQGKTNLLEAIYLLATLKPMRTSRRDELIAWSGDEAAVGGRVRHDGIARRFRIDLARGSRKVSLDGEPTSDLGAYFQGIRAIAFTPQDGAIVTDEPRVRRRWIDRAAFTAAPAHLDAVRDHSRLLKQKSAALKQSSPDPAILDVLDEQLATAGAVLAQRRVELLVALRPEIGPMHAAISGGAAELELRYRTEAAGETVRERAAALRERTSRLRNDELRRQRTLAGPHLDDVEILLDGQPARAFGSQGQVRSIVLALKLGELVAAHRRGAAPMFLLDDLSSELDAERTARLVGLLTELPVQVFITTTDAGYLRDLPADATQIVQVEGGRLTTSDP